uniref:peroxidase n=1 Tax=Acrobeloides nanus TaxID=290746 RepID=A0A914C8J2_9BILA
MTEHCQLACNSCRAPRMPPPRQPPPSPRQPPPSPPTRTFTPSSTFQQSRFTQPTRFSQTPTTRFQTPFSTTRQQTFQTPQQTRFSSTSGSSASTRPFSSSSFSSSASTRPFSSTFQQSSAPSTFSTSRGTSPFTTSGFTGTTGFTGSSGSTAGFTGSTGNTGSSLFTTTRGGGGVLGKDCPAIAQNPENAAEALKASGLINPIEDVSSRVLLSIDDITRAVSTGCVPQLSTTDCERSLCYHLSYRSFDGTCNNLGKPLLGAAFRQYIRHLPSEYDDHIAEPVSNIRKTRPSPREASRALLASSQVVTHDKYNSLVMQWGQFMSHDMAKTTLQPTANCPTCSPVPSKCIPVGIDSKDPNTLFKERGCLKISRSAPICGTGSSSPREQLNENTGFVDASMIYGSSTKDLHKFRDGRTGFLKMDRFNEMMVLPFDHSKCTAAATCKATFVAGDIRANLFIGLSSLHIMFAREHNRLATALQSLNPAWSGDRLFQEARKIVGAEVHAILYKEFLPKILGSAFDTVIGPYKGYDPNVDPTISNEFTTSGYRFGHGMLMEKYPRLDENGNDVSTGDFTFGEGVFKSNKILFEGGIDPIVRGFWSTPVKRPHRMTPAVTESMFGSTDLGSLNIQRGREHGIPSYNKWRQFCGSPPAKTFDDLADKMLDSSIRDELKKHYPSPDDMDLYVGAMVEDPVVGGLVGSTLACIIGDQFKRTRDGDRFYFENKGIFTPAQLAELHKITLSRILCDNGDRITKVPKDSFLLPQAPGNSIVPCTSLPSIDLSKWRD